MLGFPTWVTVFWIIYAAAVVFSSVYCFKKW